MTNKTPQPKINNLQRPPVSRASCPCPGHLARVSPRSTGILPVSSRNADHLSPLSVAPACPRDDLSPPRREAPKKLVAQRHHPFCLPSSSFASSRLSGYSSARRRRQAAWALTEIVVAVAILTLLLLAMTQAINASGRFNDHQWTQKRCIAAAQAQLDALTAGAEPLTNEQNQRLWPDITISLQRTPGQNQWQGLTLATATATAQSRQRKTVAITLARYIAPNPEPDR